MYRRMQVVPVSPIEPLLLYYICRSSHIQIISHICASW